MPVLAETEFIVFVQRVVSVLPLQLPYCMLYRLYTQLSILYKQDTNLDQMEPEHAFIGARHPACATLDPKFRMFSTKPLLPNGYCAKFRCYPLRAPWAAGYVFIVQNEVGCMMRRPRVSTEYLFRRNVIMEEAAIIKSPSTGYFITVSLISQMPIATQLTLMYC